MKLYKTVRGILLEHAGLFYRIRQDWDTLINRDELYQYLLTLLPGVEDISSTEAAEQLTSGILPPIGQQEVWGAGVTYLRSRDARKEESETTGAAYLYELVYDAERPELFFKSLPHRVVGHNQNIHIRRDSTWDVPEPELTLFINSSGKIQGYTVGNDMSSRSIEGENTLYLSQAKIFEKNTGLGPCLYVPEGPLPGETVIRMVILRDKRTVYEDSVTVSKIKRSFTELAGYLYRELDFNTGCFLLTGTCLVPPNDFTLQVGDEVQISIDHIGTLSNKVIQKKS